MINYSIVMRRKNVADKESEKQAYATDPDTGNDGGSGTGGGNPL